MRFKKLASWFALPIIVSIAVTLPSWASYVKSRIDAILPTQSGNSGKVLGTNATAASWVDVLKSSGGAFRVESAEITNGGACSIGRQSGSWLSSTTRPTQGQCSTTIAGSQFSVAPVCVVSPEINTNIQCHLRQDNSTSNILVDCQNPNTGVAADASFQLICMGTR